MVPELLMDPQTARIAPMSNNYDLEHAVLSYLDLHPDAADTLMGIARWWLDLPPRRLPRLAAALERLAEQGRLGRRVLRDGTVVYFGPGRD